MLEVKHLKKSFKDFKAVKDVSFTIDDGQIVGLVGPNGAGKTTTIKMISGFIQPDAGQILVNNSDLSKNQKLQRNEVATVLGGELGFYMKATAYENLNLFANLFGIKRQLRKDAVISALEQVNLAQYQNTKVGGFSRGMRQRLHIARALLKNSQILLLDEVTSGLDPESALETRTLIKDLAAQGKSILLTSHILTEIEYLADKVYLIGAGEIKYAGSIKEIVEISGVKKINRPATLEESYLVLAEELSR
ncbi:MAG: ABC transporter ATP-binding protein [Lactobacillaceae bacterium]|jgi:ABC-2 type transport system ATP-binding protein|nr:ABC transporter ATP-binding protein [Lactobacillaceae bacterium]